MSKVPCVVLSAERIRNNHPRKDLHARAYLNRLGLSCLPACSCHHLCLEQQASECPSGLQMPLSPGSPPTPAPFNPVPHAIPKHSDNGTLPGVFISVCLHFSLKSYIEPYIIVPMHTCTTPFPKQAALGALNLLQLIIYV